MVNSQQIFDYYQLYTTQTFTLDGYQAFYVSDVTYVIVSADHLSEEEAVEIKSMSDFLVEQGDQTVALIVPNVNQEIITVINHAQFVLYAMKRQSSLSIATAGTHLSLFHQRGAFYPFPVQRRHYVGQWESFWTTRLEQLEGWYGKRMRENKNSAFERAFVETFPYFLGLTENAIQYVVDSKWEDQRGEASSGGICHIRYSEGEANVYPHQLIYDHPARDIAETIRSLYWGNEKDCFKNINQFLDAYEARLSLTPFAWRMTYGRLIFPLHYFDLVESYYLTTSEEEKEKYEQQFLQMIARSDEYEMFLARFYDRIGLVAERYYIPRVAWLKRNIV